MGCTEDEQIRWLHEAWVTCEQLAASGVDIRAVTAWALLGSYDWDRLLTVDRGSYESGAFCLRQGTPRTSSVADYLAMLVADRRGFAAAHLAAGEGWWRRPERLLYGALTREDFDLRAVEKRSHRL